MSARDVLEVMALALFDDHAERMGFGYRSQHLDAKGREIAIATWKPRLIVAIRALPAGWVVAKVPSEMQLSLRPMTTPEWEEENIRVESYNAALAAIRASAVEVG